MLFSSSHVKTSAGFSYTVSQYLELPGLRALPRAWPFLPLTPRLSEAGLQVGVCSNVLQEPGIASHALPPYV